MCITRAASVIQQQIFYKVFLTTNCNLTDCKSDIKVIQAAVCYTIHGQLLKILQLT